MDTLTLIAGSIVYTLIGVRVGIVFMRARLRVSGDRDTVEAFLVGAVWPLMVLVLGVGTMLSGNSGIYDSNPH